MGIHSVVLPEVKPEHQTYLLYIRLNRSVCLQIGRLGRFHFEKGNYRYVGSAKRSFSARVKRHLQTEKTLRWHIDYLLASCYAHIISVEVSAEEECRLNQQLPGSVAIAGFGSSDCIHGCGSHLKYLGEDSGSIVFPSVPVML